MFNIKSIFPSKRLLKRRNTRTEHRTREHDERDEDEDEYPPDVDERSIEEDMLPVPQPRHSRPSPNSDGRRMRDDVGLMENEIRSLKQENGEMMKHMEELEKKLERAKEQNKAQAEQIQREASQHRHARDLLKARALELRDADAFLSKGDVTEIVGMVDGLNEEIGHAAERLSEVFSFARGGGEEEGKRKPPKDYEEAYEQARRTIGSKMARLLDHTEDRTILQVAFQANIGICCKRVIASEYFDESRYGRFLAEMVRGIRKAEDQGTCGRWRALTGAQFNRMRQEWKFVPEKDLTKDIVYHIIDVIILAGSKDGRSAIRDAVTSSLEDRLTKIVNLTLELNQVVREDITSGDLEATFIPPKTRFNPSVMEDGFGGEGGSPKDGVVLCNSELGLNQIVKRSGRGEEGGGSKRWESTVLKKPRVMVERRRREDK